MEVWNPIKGYEGYYEVSTTGKVRSCTRMRKSKNGSSHEWKGRILKTDEHITDGHLRVTLSKNNVQKRYSVHRLVAEAFIENPNNYPIVNHKNENPHDNRVENLEWCDWKYNSNYGTNKKRISLKQRGVPRLKCRKKLFQYSLDGKLLNVYECRKDAGLAGFSENNISKAIHRGNGKCRGFIWSYERIYDGKETVNNGQQTYV